MTNILGKFTNSLHKEFFLYITNHYLQITQIMDVNVNSVNKEDY